MNLNHKAEDAFNRASPLTQNVARPILELLSEGFQVTWFREVDPRIWICLIKPAPEVSEQFGLHEEYFVIGNGYSKDFHQRTLSIPVPDDLVDRVDTNLRFVASEAPVAPAFCAAWAQKNKAAVVLLPGIDNAKQQQASSGIFPLLSKTIWRRDFFSESEPVRTASEFFGRQPIVNELLSKILTGTPSAVFGLRKVGKSSLLGRVEELLYEDCSSAIGTVFLLGNATRIKSGRWWHFAQDAVNGWSSSLQRVADTVGSRVRPKAERTNDLIKKNKFDEARLARAFESDVHALIKASDALNRETEGGHGRLILFLDECDHLYPLSKGSGYWRRDYFVLWNTLQSIKRSLDDPGQLVYILSGVNPSGVEQGSIDGQPNPLYECERIYLTPMPRDEIASLLIGLGNRMGLMFEEDAISKVHELVGGHPLLVRRLGSAIHQLNPERTSRITVKTSDVSRAFSKKKRDLFNQVTWILEHLALVAPDEERLLRDVAQGGAEAYSEIWGNSEFRETYAYHLERYGLLEFSSELPILTLNIVREALKRPIAAEFMEQKRLLKDLVDSLEEMLRIRIRIDLEKTRSPEEAVQDVVSAIPSDAKNRALGHDELVDLGEVAGLEPVLQSLNWGDYEILLKKFYGEISWSGPEVNKAERLSSISSIFKSGHVVRHNNDHEIKQMIARSGYSALYDQFFGLREALSD